jgi:hypothetical protein
MNKARRRKWEDESTDKGDQRTDQVEFEAAAAAAAVAAAEDSKSLTAILGQDAADHCLAVARLQNPAWNLSLAQLDLAAAEPMRLRWGD